MKTRRRRSTALSIAVTSLAAPRLAEKLLTSDQMAQSIYDVYLSNDQLQQGRRLMRMGRWNFDGLSWYNITQLELN